MDKNDPYFICVCGDNFRFETAYQFHQENQCDAIKNTTKDKIEKQSPLEDNKESILLEYPESVVETILDQSTHIFNGTVNEEHPYEVPSLLEDNKEYILLEYPESIVDTSIDETTDIIDGTVKEEPFEELPYEVEYIVQYEEDIPNTNDDEVEDSDLKQEIVYEPVEVEEFSEPMEEHETLARIEREHNYFENDNTDSFVCELCKQRFASPRALNAHAARMHALQWREKRRARSGLKPVICEHCGNSYGSQTALRYHHRSHTGERPYACPMCSKRFAMPAQLQFHVMRHTGEKPFKCRMCPKAFPTRAGQKRHERVHTGEKPYTCQQCEKAFAQSNALKQHIRVMHLKLPSLYKKGQKRPPKQRKPSLLEQHQDDNSSDDVSIQNPRCNLLKV